MTTFSDQLAADLGTFFNADEFAESATYNGAAITVVEASQEEMNTSIPGFTVPLFTIYVKASDVSRPKAGDPVVFRGVSCRVTPFPRSDGKVWRVGLEQETVQV